MRKNVLTSIMVCAAMLTVSLAFAADKAIEGHQESSDQLVVTVRLRVLEEPLDHHLVAGHVEGFFEVGEDLLAHPRPGVSLHPLGQGSPPTVRGKCSTR